MGRKAYGSRQETAGLPKYHTIFGPGFFVVKTMKRRSGQLELSLKKAPYYAGSRRKRKIALYGLVVYDNAKPFARMGRKASGSRQEIAGLPKYHTYIRSRLFYCQNDEEEVGAVRSASLLKASRIMPVRISDGKRH